MLTVLNVAYPLAPVGPDAVGGAEQILTQLDRALTRAGHRSLVIAAGSTVTGTLIPLPDAGPRLDEAAITAARSHTARSIEDALQRWPVDLVHLHGFDFDIYLPQPGVPVLATLHCPADWYSAAALRPRRPDTWLNAVSEDQHGKLLPNPRLLAPIANGVDAASFEARHAKRNFALMLARIAPEKGVHIALAAARLADVPLLVAGELFPYAGHQHYFTTRVAPLLDVKRRCIGPVGFRRKRRLLTAARCLVVASPVQETSSLAAREALAAGTPVIALRRGALIDTIEHGRTGFLVDDERQMAAAMLEAPRIDPDLCRSAARRFSAETMTARYLALYRQLARASETLRKAGAA